MLRIDANKRMTAVITPALTSMLLSICRYLPMTLVWIRRGQAQQKLLIETYLKVLSVAFTKEDDTSVASSLAFTIEIVSLC
jgi:hypothetical protein